MAKGRPLPEAITGFIRETYKTAPELTYQQIALKVEAKFQQTVDKSTVGKLIRREGLKEALSEGSQFQIWAANNPRETVQTADAYVAHLRNQITRRRGSGATMILTRYDSFDRIVIANLQKHDPEIRCLEKKLSEALEHCEWAQADKIVDEIRRRLDRQLTLTK